VRDCREEGLLYYLLLNAILAGEMRKESQHLVARTMIVKVKFDRRPCGSDRASVIGPGLSAFVQLRLGLAVKANLAITSALMGKSIS
jgi:hypothetical protein